MFISLEVYRFSVLFSQLSTLNTQLTNPSRPPFCLYRTMKILYMQQQLFPQQKYTGGNTQKSGLEDPNKKYPVPPFQEQSQPWPGLAGEMYTQPDHGESSYIGSGRLKGRKALITGGDS